MRLEIELTTRYPDNLNASQFQLIARRHSLSASRLLSDRFLSVP